MEAGDIHSLPSAQLATPPTSHTPFLPLDQNISAQDVPPSFFHQQQPLQPQQQQQQQQPARAFSPTGPSSPTAQPHLHQLSPSQAETLAGLGLSALITNGSPFSPVDSPLSSGSPGYPGENGGGGGANQAYARGGAVSAGAALAGVMASGNGVGTTQPIGSTAAVARTLNMDLDHAFPTPPLSGPSSTASTPSTVPRPNYAYYPPPMPAVQRHHPYAHPTHSRPPAIAHSQSTSAVPMYFTSSPADPPLATPSSHITAPPSNSLAYTSPPPAPPHRVHSAPAHILTLSTQGLQPKPEPHPLSNSEIENGAEHRFPDMTGIESAGSYGGSNPSEWKQGSAIPMTLLPLQTTGLKNGGGWEGERRMSEGQQAHEERSVGYFDSTAGGFSFGNAQHGYIAPQPTPSRAVQLDSPIPAIALVRNRLPILEAALSTTASEPGNDEEEIWKGVEGAYEELKRVMLGRKEARRDSLRTAVALHGPKRSFSSMDFDSLAPVDRDRALAASKFLSSQVHPPLLHSQSTPDVPLSAQANVARAQAHVQASQVQLQQAQLEQAQAQAQQAQADAQARADAQLQADARARAEEDARVQKEALEREAETKAHQLAIARHEQHQQEQYQQQARAQHALQLQQEQHALQLQQEQHMRHAQAQVQAAQQQAQQQAAQQQQQAQQQQVQQQQQAQQQAQAQQLTSPPAYNLAASPYPHSSLGATSLAHTPHTPSPLSTTIPAHIPLVSSLGKQQLSPTSRTQPAYPVPAPQPLPVPIPLASSVQAAFGMAYDAPPPEMSSMGAMMQMHMGGIGTFPSDAMDTQAMGLPALDTGVDGVRQPWSTGTTFPLAVTIPSDDMDVSGGPSSNTRAATAAPTHTPVPAPAPAPAAIASPPHSVPASLSSGRPSRSRAASGSGSRSRAASGSGYQSVFESRSRAASSASSVFGTYERDEEDELDDEPDYEEVPHKVSSQLGSASAGVEPELRAAMDPIFLDFLADLCSNLDATDSKGEPIHQTLMAKKMERLDQSNDFRPFKFRIQAFTTAFAEKLQAAGFPDSEVPVKRIRQYLWAQPCISRFNDDGKKAKSKGNHIWTIEAKKVPDRKWIFREFTRCIKGVAPTIAFIGMPWTWTPRVWDPQCSVAAINAVFSSPSLPAWMAWDDNVLSGEAPESARGTSFDVLAVATFEVNGKAQQLEAAVSVVVASVSDHDIDLPNHTRSQDESKVDTSAYDSLVASPDLSATRTPCLSPSLCSSSLYDESTSTSTLLPSIAGMSAQPAPLQPTSQLVFAPNDPASTQDHQMRLETDDHTDSELLRHHLQRQEEQEQQYLVQTLYAQSADAQMLDSRMTIPQQSSPFAGTESQAALHQRYAALASLHSPFPAVSPDSLSYTPAPELVDAALQQAAFERNTNPTYSLDHGLGLQNFSHPQSELGTPGLLHDVDGRLANFALSQPPYTVDPQNL